ncbi:hypothetical protein BDR22DRAFT_963704 [Usnea florida]
MHQTFARPPPKMEAINQDISNRLKDFKFCKIRHPNPTNNSVDPTTSAETPFITVPHFHTKPWQQSSTTAAFNFLRQLPLIPPSTLPEDKPVCHICYEPYVHPLPTEMPTVLPCQHIFGRKCISQWIIPSQGRPKNTCPMCRSELFDDETFEAVLASPIQECTSTEWINETRRSHQDAPHADLRLEFLVQDLERIGSESALPTPTAIGADIANLQRRVNRYGDMTIAQERRRRRIVEMLGRESFLEPLRRGDGAEVGRVMQDLTRVMREVVELVTGEVDGAGTDGGVYLEDHHGSFSPR